MSKNKWLKHICIIAENYPSAEYPAFPFVQQLAYSLSNEGVNVTVIAPQSIAHALARKVGFLPKESVDSNPEGRQITVYRPLYFTFSSVQIDFLQRIAYGTMRSAIKRCLKKHVNITCVYCYFWHIGLTVAQLLEKSNTPLFVQASECWLTLQDFMRNPKYINKIKGVICASAKNKNESMEAGLVKEENTKVIVNGYRPDEFKVMDRKTMRKQFGWSNDKFIVAFVGGFIERKGIMQLCQALNQFDDAYSIFIGSGEDTPNCKNVLFSGKVMHDHIAKYLNAADVFVLPTHAEGCCNAIIEALACGLPVISSNKSFNDELLDANCSIRIDESSVTEIYNAIRLLKEDENRRQQMSMAALNKAKQFTIDIRAKAIKSYIEEKLNVEE